MRIGVLELQGDFEKHHQILQTLGMDSVAVRGPSDLDELEGLVIPGGESTTISLLIDRNKLREPLKAFADVYPVLGTCAGLILMARKVSDSRVNPLGILDVVVCRNAYGRQIHSTTEEVKFFEDKNSFYGRATMIRAPRIESTGRNIEVLGSLNGHPVAIRENHHIGLIFHPELDGVTIFHELAFHRVKQSQHDRKSQTYVT